MASEIQKGFCDVCGRERTFYRREINHKLHFILSIITGGLWLISWASLVMLYSHASWTCGACGAIKHLQPSKHYDEVF